MKRIRPHIKSRRFVQDITAHTPFIRMVAYLLILWFMFSLAIFYIESRVADSPIRSLGDALYWGVAAFSTAGIADTPTTGMAKAVGGVWIVIGSMLFFGTIVATITTYFARPMQRPHRKIIETIEYNLEQLGDLELDELDLLKETVDALIEHVERIKSNQRPPRDPL
jgi:voltage-gated potassium channel